MIRLLTATLLVASFSVVALSSIADTPEETDATGGLPIWLLYQAAVAAGPCVPPGIAITDSNFDAAITDWIGSIESGVPSAYGDISQWCTGAVTDMSDAFREKAHSMPTLATGTRATCKTWVICSFTPARSIRTLAAGTRAG